MNEQQRDIVFKALLAASLLVFVIVPNATAPFGDSRYRHVQDVDVWAGLFAFGVFVAAAFYVRAGGKSE